MSDPPDKPDTPAPTPDDADTLSSGGLEATHAPEPAGSSLIGTKIGGFSLKRIIGSGGMGTVYEAMQEQPRRRVAVKMMKRGITSKSALRRFEFESQLLGRLQHPGIAQVYEAGTHDEGSGGVPYFAMEYIANARSLTEYAAEKKLGTRERLALFAKVCDAVQHGHLKGIVHRDLKPGNILVDSSGQPKIIDFGVARSTDSDMAVTTLQTDVGQLVGTLQYMSPEQCAADSTDIDARSDVYAMGVVLYELLTGKPPYDVRQAAIHEAVRMVREEEPTKLSTIDRHLRGDIETIALKALEKERDRRYQSATELEQDISRYLSDEPIAAKAPGAIDYLRRFARKHRAAAVAISSIFLVLVVAVIAVSIFAINAERAKTRAESARDFMTDMFSSLNPQSGGGSAQQRIEHMLLDASDRVGTRFIDQPEVEARIRTVIGHTYLGVGLYEAAETHYRKALETRRRVLGNNHVDTLDVLGSLGYVLKHQGAYTEAEPYLRESLQGLRHTLGDEHIITLNTINSVGLLLSDQGRYDEAKVLFAEAIETGRRVFGVDHGTTLWAIKNMGVLLTATGEYADAERYHLESLSGHKRVFGEEHPFTLESINNMGSLLLNQGKYDEAEVYYTEALETSRRVLGDEHPDTLKSIGYIGNLFYNQGMYDEAEAYYLQELEGYRRVLGEGHPDTLYAIGKIGSLLKHQGQYGEAEAYSLQALEGSRRSLGDEHPDTLIFIAKMGGLLAAQGKYDEAKMYYLQALEGSRRVLGDEHPDTLSTIGNMGDLLRVQGKYDEAEVYLIQALEGHGSNLGDDHPHTLWMINSLIELYDAWGKPEESQKYRDMLPAQEEASP